ncbi:glycosyltransferase family 2 protein [Chryseobacterium shigense]|uniref:Glycosyltransferase involved in cell wall biosynthesis n=1 Tax=Chryseobacterium shigense TaxID=297244 RepID=A0A841NHK2_9FLAO|nr:glycosyltransferase family 2 protein [Chryseobacterium shigense]MBB6372690.1 glycosyltransferase involved in cell wall biosynthesis [Chryseobacterium shigense]
MNTPPLVSLIIITMNHEKFIKQACVSAISQTYPNYEIIFLDNASRDRTFENAEKVLSKFGQHYEMIRNTENFGVAKNINIAVSHASGEYISLLSGDDWYTEDSLSEKVSYIQKNPIDFILSDGYKYYQAEDKTTDAYTPKEKKHIIDSLDNFFHENVSENKTANVGTFVKRDLLVQYPFDESINTEDWDMNLRLTSKGFKIGFIDKKLFYYRILSTSLSRNWKLMKDSYEKVTYKYIDYIKADKELYKKYRLKLIHFKYEILLSETTSESEKQYLRKEWKKEKYRVKYKNPILFFKLLMLK